MASLDGLGSVLRALRERRGLSQEALAAQTGLDRANLSRFENHVSGPDDGRTLGVLERLLDFYGLDLLDLGCELRRARAAGGPDAPSRRRGRRAVRKAVEEGMKADEPRNEQGESES